MRKNSVIRTLFRLSAVVALLAVFALGQARPIPPSATSIANPNFITVPPTATSTANPAYQPVAPSVTSIVNMSSRGVAVSVGRGRQNTGTFGGTPINVRIPRHHAPGAYPVYVPYAYAYPVAVEVAPVEAPQAQEAPKQALTIFDRGTYTPLKTVSADEQPKEAKEEVATASVAPGADAGSVRDLPSAVLVFRDGHKQEVKNFAIIGDTLYSFESLVVKKIKLSDLDLKQTIQLNDERGSGFAIPVKARKVGS